MPIFSFGDDEEPEPFLSQAAGASKAVPKAAKPAPAGQRAMQFDNALDDDEDDPFEDFNVDKDDMDTDDAGSHAPQQQQQQQRQQRTAAPEPAPGKAGAGQGSSGAAEEQQAVRGASQQYELQAGTAPPASQPADESHSVVAMEVEEQQSFGLGGTVPETQLQPEATMEDVPDETELQEPQQPAGQAQQHTDVPAPPQQQRQQAGLQAAFVAAPASQELQHAGLRAEEAVVDEEAAPQGQQLAGMELDGAGGGHQAEPAAAGGGNGDEQQLAQDADAAQPPAEAGDANRHEVTPRDFRIVSTTNAATLPHTHEVVKHLDFGPTPARPGRFSLCADSLPTSAGPEAPAQPAAAEQEPAHTGRVSDGAGEHGTSPGGAPGSQAAAEADSEMHNAAPLEQNPLMPGGDSPQPGSAAPGSQLTQPSPNSEPSRAGTGAQPEQGPAGRVLADQAAASVEAAESPEQSMSDAEQGAPAAAAPAAEAGGTGAPAGRPEAAAAAGNAGPLEPLQTVSDAAAGHGAPLLGPKVAAAAAEPGRRASGRADGSAGAALAGLPAPAAVQHGAPLAPDMEQAGAAAAGDARTLGPEAGTGRAPASTQQGGSGGQAAPHGQAQAEADPKALAGPSPVQGLVLSKGKPAANQLAAWGQTVLSKPASASSLHFSHPQQPHTQQAGFPLPSGQAAAVLAGHSMSQGPAAAGRNSPVAVSLPTHLPSALGAPGSLGGSLRPWQPSLSQAARGSLLGGGPEQMRMPMRTAAGASGQTGSTGTSRLLGMSNPFHRLAHRQQQLAQAVMHARLPSQGLAAGQGGHVPRSQPGGLPPRFPGTSSLGLPQPRAALGLQGAAAHRQQPSMAGAVAGQAGPVSGTMSQPPQGMNQGFSFHGCSSLAAAGTGAPLHAPEPRPTAAPRASAAQQAAPARPTNGGHRQPREGDRPLSGGDKPHSGGSRPHGGGDRQPTGGDRPLSGGDKPHSRGCRPHSGGDRPPAGGHRQPTGGDRPLSGRAAASAAPAPPASKAGSGGSGPSQGGEQPMEDADSSAQQRAEETRQREAAEMNERMKRNDEALKRLQQAMMETQSMRDSIMEYTVQAAIYSNRLTRLNNPVVVKKLGDLKRRAEALVAET